MRRLLLLPLAGLLICACFSAPAPHPRALENNEICAQYVGAGDLVKAETYCDLGLQFSPQYSDLWVNKGLIYLRRSQTDKAKECFIKALRYNPEQAQAYNNLGYIYLTFDSAYGKAHDNFQRALKVNPDYTEARYNLALTYMRMGDKENARKELRTIITVNGNLADPHQYLGVMALEEGALEEAVEELQKATGLAPDYDDAWLNLGNAFMEAGRFKDAKDAFSSCIEANQKNAQCRNNLPIAVRKGALSEPALKEIAEQQGAENSAPSLLQKGKYLRDKGLKNEEERAYRKCVKLDGRYAPCHFALYELYSEDRRDKEALIACKNFLKFATADEFPKEYESCDKYVTAH